MFGLKRLFQRKPVEDLQPASLDVEPKAVEVVHVLVAEGVSEREVVSLAAGLGMGIANQIGHALMRAATERGVSIAGIDDVQPNGEDGFSGTWDEGSLLLGKESLLERSGISLPSQEKNRLMVIAQEGSTIYFVAKGDTYLGAFVLI